MNQHQFKNTNNSLWHSVRQILSRQHFVLPVLLLFILLISPGCGKWWGEAPPPEGQIDLAGKESGCPESVMVLKASTDQESSQAFECWATEIQKIWTQVYGEIPNQLKASEVKTLIRKRIVVLDIPLEDSLKMVDSAFKLFGFGESLTRDGMTGWIDYLREQRPLMQTIYQRFTQTSLTPSLTDEELSKIFSAMRTLIQMTHWSESRTFLAVQDDLGVVFGGLSEGLLQNFKSATTLFALDGQGFYQKVQDRLTWLVDNSSEVGHFYRSIVVQGLSVKMAGIGRFIRGISHFITETPILESVTLSQLNFAVDNLFGLSPKDNQQLNATEQLLQLKEVGFLKIARTKGAWLAQHWDVLQKLFIRLRDKEQAPFGLATDGEFKLFLDEVRGLFITLDWAPTVTWDAVLEQLEIMGAISSVVSMPDAVSSRQQMYAIRLLLDLPPADFTNTVLKRLDLVEGLLPEVAHFYRELALKKSGLGKAGLGRFFKLLHHYFAGSSIDPKFTLRSFTDRIQEVFGLDKEDRKQLEAALILAGIPLESSGDLYLKLMPRLQWIATNWSRLEDLFTHLNGSSLFNSLQGKGRFELVFEFLEIAQWNSLMTFEVVETQLREFTKFTSSQELQLKNVRDFLDLNGTNFSAKLKERLRFFSSDWDQISKVYLWLNDPKRSMNFASVTRVLEVTGKLLSQLKWFYKTDQVLEKIYRIGNITDLDTKKLLPPLLDLSLNLFGHLCPTLSTIEFWSSPEVGACFRLLPKLLKGGESWIDLVLNPIERPPTEKEIKRYRESLARLNAEIKTWAKDKRRFPIHTRKILAVAAALGAEPPKDFIQSLSIVEAFGGESTREKLFNSATSHIFAAFTRYQDRVLRGLPSFVRAWNDHACVSSSQAHARVARIRTARDWGDCVPEQMPSQIDVITIALQMRNPHYGQKVVPLSGNRFSETMLFYTIAEELLLAFDKDHDGIIKATASEETNEVVRMMSVTVGGYDTLLRFMNNVKNKLNGKPIEETSAPISFAQYDQKGLSKLVTLFATDILVTRPEQENKGLIVEFGKLLSSFVEVAQKSAVFMDHKGISAALGVVSGLTDFRKAWIKIIDPELHRDLERQLLGLDQSRASQKGLNRKKVVESFKRYLERHFPRTAQSCGSFGFHRSCGIILDEVLAKGKNGVITQGDLDAITLFLMGIEGLVDSCDYNGDALLSFDVFKGHDELSCALKKGVDAVNRLIAAKILNVDDPELVQLGLGVAKLHKVTQIFGKVALIEGESSWLVFSPISAPFHIMQTAFSKKKGRASIGSIYGLASDIAAPDRVKTEGRRE